MENYSPCSPACRTQHSTPSVGTSTTDAALLESKIPQGDSDPSRAYKKIWVPPAGLASKV
jgi:hypothetical protein